jgi:quinoprotein glucose dehydrogenase
MAKNRLISLAFSLAISTPVLADIGWSHYGGSEKGLQHSTLSQINLINVGQLKEVWRYRTGELSQDARDGYSFQTNPILVRNKLYLTTGSGIIIAIEPGSGKEIWRFDPKLDRGRSTSETANRGVSSWVDPQTEEDDLCHHRIMTGLLDSRLIAVDGKTGKPCQDFGENGELDLSKNVNLVESDGYDYSITSPPVIVGDIIISGSSIGDNRGVELERGIVRGFDVRSGKEIWSFDPIPRNDKDPAYSNWLPDEAKKNSAANAWAPLSADSELGLVYVPTGSASPDFYGGERQGDNLYANSLVALDAKNGEVRWFQQLVHHDVWDYDLPAQPTLVDLERGNETIPAVIQATKTGLLFTFNRINGEPIFEVEERPVPQGGVPGEHLSPTQPFPVAPPPLLNHQAITGNDAWGLVGFDEWDCANQFDGLRSEGIFTPPSLEGTIMMPSYIGGINWGGVAFNTERQIAVVRVTEVANVIQLIKREDFKNESRSGKFPDSQFTAQKGTPYGMRRQVITSLLDSPCTAPPWGWVKAIDMLEGKILWQVPHGTIEDLAPAPVPNLALGVPGIGGPITTGGDLIFIAAALDDYIRALDINNGNEVWKARLPAGGQATPMTYLLEGKQYVVIAAGGHKGAGSTMGDYVIAYAL